MENGLLTKESRARVQTFYMYKTTVRNRNGIGNMQDSCKLCHQGIEVLKQHSLPDMRYKVGENTWIGKADSNISVVLMERFSAVEPLLQQRWAMSQINFQISYSDFQKLPLSLLERDLLVQALVAGQISVLSLVLLHIEKNERTKLKNLFSLLQRVESLYRSIGGILGYCRASYEKLLTSGQVIPESDANTNSDDAIDRLTRSIRAPVDILLASDYQSFGDSSQREILATLGVCLVVGGAGDRLDFNENGSAMPAALYPFGKGCLLSSILEEIEAMNVIMQRAGLSQRVPVALMTSCAKGGDLKIQESLERWGYSPDDYIMFSQSLVPVFDNQGLWVALDSGELWSKPGGHGALWQEGEMHGVWDHFHRCGCHTVAVRQINNPNAWRRNKLFQLLYATKTHNKKIGFLSSPRQEGKSEGVHLQMQVRSDQGGAQVLYKPLQMEYVELDSLNVENKQELTECPTNTNVFCVDLDFLRSSICIPGLVVNVKPMRLPHTLLQLQEREGSSHVTSEWMSGGRLESMMQNVVEFLPPGDFPLFLHFPRSEVMSAIKKAWKNSVPQVEGKDESFTMSESAMSAFLDQQNSWNSFLERVFEYCGSEKSGLHSALIYLHPLLESDLEDILKGESGGHQVSALHNCVLEEAALLWLDVGTAQLQSCYIDGACKFVSHFLNCDTYVRLNDCVISNKNGVKSAPKQNKLVQQFERFQTEGGASTCGGLQIIFEGAGFFEASGIYFLGDFTCTVPAGWKLTVFKASDLEDSCSSLPLGASIHAGECMQGKLRFEWTELYAGPTRCA